MVVLGIIAVLAALLLAGLSRARGVAQAVACQNNLHQLMVGVLAFAATNDDSLPGNFNDVYNATPADRSWLTGNSLSWTDGPQLGTLYTYLASNPSVYRCPSLDVAVRTPTTSNGRFDYSIFSSLSGARLNHVQPTSIYLYLDGHTVTVATPVIVEEDPWYGVNNLDLIDDAGAHVDVDRLAHTHGGQGYYAAIDGSVQPFNEPILPATASPTAANRWESRGPSGNWVGLGYTYANFGWWNWQ
jgi:type II secretory pathway pseudopilin PulG